LTGENSKGHISGHLHASFAVDTILPVALSGVLSCIIVDYREPRDAPGRELCMRPFATYLAKSGGANYGLDSLDLIDSDK
jgi:hypothetical protein